MFEAMRRYGNRTSGGAKARRDQQAGDGSAVSITGRIAGWTARHAFITLGAWVVVLVAALMALAGLAKFTGPEVWTGMFEDWGYPAWFSFVIGGAEFVGALLLILPRFATYAATGLTIIMVGALATVIIIAAHSAWVRQSRTSSCCR